MMNNSKCDSCGYFLDPEHWKECDKCRGKDREHHKQHYKEIIKHESGTQDD
nr:MAG TPA_asm: hydrogenase/urease nickel incorporation protein [Caudoviricetes sp.]